MKNLILILTMLLSFSTFAKEAPTHCAESKANCEKCAQEEQNSKGAAEYKVKYNARRKTCKFRVKTKQKKWLSWYKARIRDKKVKCWYCKDPNKGRRKSIKVNHSELVGGECSSYKKDDLVFFNTKSEVTGCEGVKERYYCKLEEGGKVVAVKIDASDKSDAINKAKKDTGRSKVKLHKKESRALKDKACKIKTKERYYCKLEENGKVVAVKIDAIDKSEALNKAKKDTGRDKVKLYKKESRALKDKACKVKTKERYYCKLVEGKPTAVKVDFSDKNEAKKIATADTGRDKVKFFKKESRALKDRKCKVKTKERFYCKLVDGKPTAVSVDFMDKEAAKKTATADTGRDKVKFYKKESRALKDKACKVVEDQSCYFCDPETGKTVEVNKEYVDGKSGKGGNWSRVVNKKKFKCEKLKRRQIKKFLTKAEYLGLEKMLNASSKYYSKGVLKKITKSGKKIFKKVQKAPLFTKENEALDWYGKFGLESFNKCAKCESYSNDQHTLAAAACAEGEEYDNSTCKCIPSKKSCNTKLGKDYVENLLLDTAEKTNTWKKKCETAKGKWVPVKPNGFACKFPKFICPFKAKSVTKLYCGNKYPKEVFEVKKKACQDLVTKGVPAKWSGDETCECSVDYSASLDVNYDACEYAFTEDSFDDTRSLFNKGTPLNERSGKSEWSDAKNNMSSLVNKTAAILEAGLTCSYEIKGFASDTAVSKDCMSHLNKSTRKSSNQELGDRRAQYAKAYFEGEVSGKVKQNSCYIDGSCTGEIRGDNQVHHTPEARDNQGFTLGLSCKSVKLD